MTLEREPEYPALDALAGERDLEAMGWIAWALLKCSLADAETPLGRPASNACECCRSAIGWRPKTKRYTDRRRALIWRLCGRCDEPDDRDVTCDDEDPRCQTHEAKR